MGVASVPALPLVVIAVVVACYTGGAESQNSTSSATTAAVCMNTITDCHYHQKEEICRGIYKPWASARCALYCGFCTPPEGWREQCEDTIPNCEQYQPCNNRSFFVWVEDHCRHCGNDTDVTATSQRTSRAPQSTPKLTTLLPTPHGVTTSGTTPGKPSATPSVSVTTLRTTRPSSQSVVRPGSTVSQASPTCQDQLAFCRQYAKSACSNTVWATTYCARYCNLCDAVQASSTKAPATNKPASTSKQETETIGGSVVTSPSHEVTTSARLQSSTSGLSPSCRDQLASCNLYSKVACQNEQWGRTYCARLCNLCA